jgi:hypothetical protein
VFERFTERARQVVVLAQDEARALSNDYIIGGTVESVPRPHRSRKRCWFLSPSALLVAGWLLFALALGAGILVGWAIWG